MPSPEQVAEFFRYFALEPGVPLYNRLSVAAADEPWLCELVSRAKPGQARPVLLLAAVHRLVLDHPDEPLAQWYPTVTGEPVPSDDPVPAFLAFCRTFEPELTHLVETRSTQTNEVSRAVAVAAALRPATADLPDTPIALVELGPSAGLNLHADQYAISWDEDAVVHQAPSSPVRLRCRAKGDPPDVDAALAPIVARIGLDLDPIDVRTDHDDVAWLEACLWPEQLERFERFRAAAAVTAADPPTFVRGDLIDDLPLVLDGLPPDVHAFVFHTWVLTYVAKPRRPELAERLRAAARQRPVSWFSAEAATVVPEVPATPTEDLGLTMLGLTTFRSGVEHTRLLGTSHPHLAWISWGSGPPSAA